MKLKIMEDILKKNKEIEYLLYKHENEFNWDLQEGFDNLIIRMFGDYFIIYPSRNKDKYVKINKVNLTSFVDYINNYRLNSADIISLSRCKYTYRLMDILFQIDGLEFIDYIDDYISNKN